MPIPSTSPLNQKNTFTESKESPIQESIQQSDHLLSPILDDSLPVEFDNIARPLSTQGKTEIFLTDLSNNNGSRLEPMSATRKPLLQTLKTEKLAAIEQCSEILYDIIANKITITTITLSDNLAIASMLSSIHELLAHFPLKDQKEIMLSSVFNIACCHFKSSFIQTVDTILGYIDDLNILQEVKKELLSMPVYKNILSKYENIITAYISPAIDLAYKKNSHNTFRITSSSDIFTCVSKRNFSILLENPRIEKSLHQFLKVVTQYVDNNTILILFDNAVCKKILQIDILKYFTKQVLVYVFAQPDSLITEEQKSQFFNIKLTQEFIDSDNDCIIDREQFNLIFDGDIFSDSPLSGGLTKIKNCIISNEIMEETTPLTII